MKVETMELQTFLLFVTTTMIVVFSPGPAAVSIASQGAANNYSRAIFGVIGVAMANAAYFLMSATGISALIIASNTIFMVIKWVGVAYLAYLGLSAMLSKSGGFRINPSAPSRRSVLFAKGFAVEFANPKALLYFAAILPQFIDPGRPIMTQIFIMGLTTMIIDLIAYSIYANLGRAIAVSGMKGWIVKGINKIAGVALLVAAFKVMRATPG